MTPLIGNGHNRQIHRGSKWVCGARDGRKRMRSDLVGTGSPWWGWECDVIGVMSPQHSERPQILRVHLTQFYVMCIFVVAQSLSRVRLFATPWTAAHQASLSITNSQSLLKLMSLESVMPSSHLILFRPLLLLPSIFPSIRVFPMSQLLASGGQSIGAAA